MPASAIKHRLSFVLKPGSEYLQNRLSQISVPVLVLAGESDNTLPSEREARRLADNIPKGSRKMFKGGHLILDDRVNVTDIIRTSNVAPLSWKKDPVTG